MAPNRDSRPHHLTKKSTKDKDHNTGAANNNNSNGATTHYNNHNSHSTATFPRAESASSNGTTAAPSYRTFASTNPSSQDQSPSQLFTQRHGRVYLKDQKQPYPLPVDLDELHRQSLRTLLLIQYFGSPVCCPSLKTNPPKRVLEIGCGPGFWSMMAHRYYKALGYGNIEFVGIDIAPLALGSGKSGSGAFRPDKDMDWTFIRCDMMSQRWPFEDGEFDMVMNKDMTLAVSFPYQIHFITEATRMLKSGGIIEMWETDHTIRMLRPHVPKATEEHETAQRLGAYALDMGTPLSPPLNPYIVEFNRWVSQALEARQLIANPCTTVTHNLYSQTDTLTDVGFRRVAIPLNEIRWESDGVGGVVTKDGKSYVEMKERPPPQRVEKKTLTPGQEALRRTALLTLVQEIQALELTLREVNGKSQDEWDVWLAKMTNDLMNEGGASWGECLESGVWWAKKL